MERDIFEFIEIWYNRKRRHSALDYKKIEEFWKKKNNFKNVAYLILLVLFAYLPLNNKSNIGRAEVTGEYFVL
jgi:transposase InsO family protein